MGSSFSYRYCRILNLFYWKVTMEKSWQYWGAGILAVSGVLVWTKCTAESPISVSAPPPRPIMYPSSGPQQTPPSFRNVNVIAIQKGQTIWSQRLKIGGWSSSTISISEPTGELVQCDGRSRAASPVQQVNVSIHSVGFGQTRDSYNINARYSRTEGEGACMSGQGRSVTVQQVFQWTGNAVNLKIDDDFQIRIVPAP